MSSAPGLRRGCCQPWEKATEQDSGRQDARNRIEPHTEDQIIFHAIANLLFRRTTTDKADDILVITRADLFPVDHGAAVKIIRTAESLSRLGRNVWLCTDKRREYYRFRQGEMTTLRYPLWLWFLALPRPLALARLLLRGFPFSNAFLYFPLTDASYAVRALWLAATRPVGACIAEFPAYVLPAVAVRTRFGGRVMLVEHNVEYRRLAEQIPGLRAASYRALKDIEMQMCEAADVVVTVSENDRLQLQRDGVPADKLHTIPHGVDIRAMQKSVVGNVREQYGIPGDDLLLVYHGTYSYPPNLEAVSLLATEILPRLERSGLSVSVLAIGSRPPSGQLHPAIHFTGSVPDLATILPAADMAVIPLQDGGGTRMKILDYFAAGVPVISTAKGIEGIPVTNGTEALVLDDYDDMAAAVARLAADAEARRALVDRASRFVNVLGWDELSARYIPLLFEDKSARDFPDATKC